MQRCRRKDVTAAFEGVEVEGVEFWGIFQTRPCPLEFVIGIAGEAVVFKIENKYCHSAYDRLTDELFENVPGLARSGTAHDEGAAVNVQVDNVLPPAVLKAISTFQMEEIRMGQESFFLWEALAILVE